MSTFKIWRLKNKEERRYKQGHPWVYSNELQESPKTANGKPVEPGEWIELHDSSGSFLALGFANPNSLISFRTFSKTKITAQEQIAEAFYAKIKTAAEFRARWYQPTESYRLVYGEVDGLSGLVIDRFVSSQKIVYIVQPHSAGMDRNLEFILGSLSRWSEENDPTPGIAVLRRDAGSREREGLEKEPTLAVNLKDGDTIEDVEFLKSFDFQVPSSRKMVLTTDLISGQKTGFFFDQLQNVRLLQNLMQLQAASPGGDRGATRILDLCSYIGQWGAQLAQTAVELKSESVEVTCVDSSESALKFAETNVKRLGNSVSFRKIKADVLETIPGMKDNYSIVVADPPAFIKSRKAIPQGKQAYVSLFTKAIQATRENGLVVCCSCSQLLSREEMQESLAKAVKRSGKSVKWIAQGSPAIDHFSLMEFPESIYLKCWIGEVGPGTV